MKFTLVTDGPSDQALIPILVWLLRAAGVNEDLQPQWADLRNLRKPPSNLAERLRTSLELYPCDLLFVHRDAERQPRPERAAEISEAIEEIQKEIGDIPQVSVIPVRMQEAWLLFNKQAIRAAAGNPGGTVALQLPRLRDTEGLPDPKAILFELLRTASELNARRLKRFPLSHARKMVPEYIDDFSPLRELPAFAWLESKLRDAVQSQ